MGILTTHRRMMTIDGLQSVSMMHAGRLGAGGIDWWDPNGDGLCVWAAYQPKGAASFAASLVDLSGNGNDAIDPGGGLTPGWDAVNGWDFTLGLDYLTTTFVHHIDQSQSCLMQFTNGSGTGYMFGAKAGFPSNFGIRNNHSTPRIYYLNGNQTPSTIENSLVAGNLAVAGVYGYRDGAVDSAAIATGNACTYPCWIGCMNNAGSPYAGGTSAYFQAFAIYDCVLTAPQVATVAAAMAAL